MDRILLIASCSAFGCRTVFPSFRSNSATWDSDIANGSRSPMHASTSWLLRILLLVDLLISLSPEACGLRLSSDDIHHSCTNTIYPIGCSVKALLKILEIILEIVLVVEKQSNHPIIDLCICSIASTVSMWIRCLLSLWRDPMDLKDSPAMRLSMMSRRMPVSRCLRIW